MAIRVTQQLSVGYRAGGDVVESLPLIDSMPPPEPERFFAVLDDGGRVVAWYSDKVHGDGVPVAAVPVSADERVALLSAQAGAVLDTSKPAGARVVPVDVPPPPPPPTKAERAAAELAGSPALGALVSELAARLGVTRAALLSSIASRAT